MSNFTPTYPGQVNGAGDARATLLKVFSGEVLTSFEQANVTTDKHTTITISHGKSTTFPVIGRTTAAYHTSGTELNGNVIKTNEKVIHIDGVLIADTFIGEFDEKMSHYEIRSKLATELGRALANTYDKHVLQVGVLAARATSTINDADQFGGTVIYEDTVGMPASADFVSSGDDMAEAIFYGAQVLDEKSVPQEGRFCFLRPQQYNNLVKSTKAINRDWGGEGSYASGNVMRISGVVIVKTINLPSTNITTGVASGNGFNSYAGDFSDTVGLIWHESAVGTVKLMDLATEDEYSARHQGTLLIAKYAVGHGILRPEAAVEIRAAAETP
jgi:hypothetical protein